MRSSTPNRRSLLGAAACLSALAATPVLGASRLPDAGTSPDAELLTMSERLATVRARAEAAADASSKASEAYQASQPPAPDALRITSQDRHHWPYLHQDVDETHFHGMRVLGLREQSAHEERCGGRPTSGPHARYRHERGQEVIGAWSAWRTACETGRCGELRQTADAIEERCQAAYDDQWALEVAIRERPAHTLAGIRAKALSWREDEASDQETLAFMRGLRADLARLEA